MATPIEDDVVPETVAADTKPPAEESVAEELVAEESGTKPAVPVEEPVAHAAFHGPGEELGDTPLSAIERLSAPMDLSPKIRRHDRFLTAAWAGSFAVLAALGVAGYTKREALMREWPASKRVYSTLGLAPLDAKTTERKPQVSEQR
jgi:hypothetical protein